MKQQSTKKFLIFLITVIMFCFTNESVDAQNSNLRSSSATGYLCKCGLHGYGCGTNHACINYCTSRCGGMGVNNEPSKKNPSQQDLRTARITFTLDQAKKISAKIFDMTGRLVNELVAGQMLEKGNYELNWNTEDVNTGTYILQFDVDNYSETKKLLGIK